MTTRVRAHGQAAAGRAARAGDRRDVIAHLLDGAALPAPLQQWAATAAGRREIRAYRRTLRTLDALYGSAAAQRAADAALHYATMASPIGPLFVAASDRGVVRVGFRCSERSFVGELQRRLRRRPVRSIERLAPVTAELDAYFAGRRRALELPVDLRDLTQFQRRVLMAARGVPAGSVVSYGEIARRIGIRKASRAVGQALGRNPVPIVIPCHRIVREGGDLGGYTGGLDVKRTLLRIEGVAVA
jgi:methylated-DNA-[protein]-cysteine S-methyltransferase